jgi:glycosyltransferase involved in cell wall biosynthesis
MRVVMIILEYHPIVGGAQRQLAEIAPLLRDAGVDVQILTRRARGLPAYELIDEVPVHRLPAPGPKAIASVVFVLAALARLRTLRPDVIHAYSLFSPCTIAVLAHRLLGVPSVVKVLRGGYAGDVERLRRKPFAWLRIRSLRALIDRYAVISREIDLELDALGVPEVHRVALPNGVNVERFRPADPEERKELRDSLDWSVGPSVIYCGRLVPEKRVDLLIEAWKTVRRHHPSAVLDIVGGGPCETELRSTAGEGVRFVGEVADVVPYLRASDIFALPSATEGLSNAMLEAMAVGLPVLASSVGGNSDLVADRVTGRLIPAEDGEALTTALLELLEDPDRARLGAAARLKITESYSLGSIAERLHALYRELTPSGQSAGTPPKKGLDVGVLA